MNCPKCLGEVSNVDTFCPSCGEFLKEQEFERRREDRSFHEADFKATEKGAKRLIVACPKCKQKLSVPEQETVLDVTCPKCQATFRYDFQEKS